MVYGPNCVAQSSRAKIGNRHKYYQKPVHTIGDPINSDLEITEPHVFAAKYQPGL